MRITLRENHFDMENSSFIKGILRASDVRVPDEDVIREGPGCDSNSGDFFLLNFLEVLDESLLREGEIFFADSCPQQSLIR